MSIYYIVVITG